MLYLVDNPKIKNGKFILKDNELDFMTTPFTGLFNKQIIIESELELDYPTVTEQEKLDLIAESDRQRANDITDDKRLELMENAINDLILGGM